MLSARRCVEFSRRATKPAKREGLCNAVPFSFCIPTLPVTNTCSLSSGTNTPGRSSHYLMRARAGAPVVWMFRRGVPILRARSLFMGCGWLSIGFWGLYVPL